MLPHVVAPLLLLGNVSAMDGTGGDPEPTPEPANDDDNDLSVVAIILIIFGSVSGGLLLLLVFSRWCFGNPLANSHSLDALPNQSRPSTGAFAGMQTGAYPMAMTQLGARSYAPVSQVDQNHPNCEDVRRLPHFPTSW
tara:strand:- start:1984 stop:2397 length:414 start_codon:yes stop_codon:yes gene_type:complete